MTATLASVPAGSPLTLPPSAASAAPPTSAPPVPGVQAVPTAATAPSIGAIIVALQNIVQQLQSLVGALQAGQGAATLGGGAGVDPTSATAPGGGASSASCACCGGGGGAGTASFADTGSGGALGAPDKDAKSDKGKDKQSDAKPAGGTSPVSQAEIKQWVEGDTEGLNPELLGKLAQLGKELGQKIHITSGFRTREEQQHLYDLYKAGKGNLAAPPGHSNHESGNAADASVGGVSLRDDAQAKAAALKLGLTFPVPSESWHVELAK